ncbi:HPF/RaiA family ribosome-associated protein [Alkalilimnicola sp. S0819]|uniref:HPF/RaiA family ribosome-associated protein n=1 Tax=Alkalilimnicola sp. S0819 TaxID=2613922 RepID=UPI00186A3890|nr:HPF/RaiA family ribosome-associated protein [Alkalilimnicola sp. S0819]
MGPQPQISFHGLNHSEEVASYVRERAARLARLCESATSCRVVLERPHAPHRPGEHSGNELRVRVEVGLPEKRLLIGDKCRVQTPLLRLETLVREAFEAVERQIPPAVH